jgi:hypothetical protein
MGWLAENWLWVAGSLLLLFFVYRFARPGQAAQKTGGRQKAKMSPALVDAYFQRYKWMYQRTAPGVWQTGWRSNVASFQMFVKLTSRWIYFTVSPFVSGPIDPNRSERLNHYLLRLNRDINMAKFCLDSDRNIVLTVEMPCANLDYEEFADALNTLCHYAEDVYIELRNLARNPTAPSRYD